MRAKRAGGSSRKTPKKAPPKTLKKVAKKATELAAPRETAAAGFPVVGLGASAGGLEAFEEFFRSVPTNTGMAFVLVSHLDPSHESILTEIVQRTTALPVVEVTDQLSVKPNCIYVIPPNKDLSIFHGKLHLSAPDAPRGQRLPIDAFFRSLAEDQGDRAIGVVLSGTGSDGSLGLRAIQGVGGLTFAQDPTTAKYDGMPAAAIRTGYAAHVLPVEKMAEAMRILSRAPGIRFGSPSAPAIARGLGQILAVLRTRTGHDFSLYKKSTLIRRIERRMVQHDIETPEAYARYLREHPGEVQLLFKELLINVTSFFRDPDAFEVLRKEILPTAISGKPEGWVFRAWVAGCASGEEAYSIAILLRELMDEVHVEFKVQLYATDLDEDAITMARTGVYTTNIAQDVTPERLRRFFIKDEAGYRVKKEIREMVVFAVQDVIKDPPFTRLDLLSCRNLMIYLEPEAQERLIETFHYALRPGGVLFLSPSESLGHPVDLFRPISRKWRLFAVVPSATSTRPVSGSIRPRSDASEPAHLAGSQRKAREGNVAEMTARALMQTFAPASVVTDLSGNIVYVHGDTGRYLRPAPGKATLNVIDMARGALEVELRTALHGAVRKGAPSIRREVPAKVGGAGHPLLLTVHPLGPQSGGDGLLLVSFQEQPRGTSRRAEAGRKSVRSTERLKDKEMEEALSYTKELLRTTVEEQQASTEELKSMNEELQSTNEELQSTNEELETSKEELQSVNEELVTVNAELQTKIDLLAGMQNDMRNLLDNVSGGVIFLDARLAIRRFTREATKVFRLVATDVGRPLADIKGEPGGDGLLAAARAVLDSLVPREQDVPLASGGTYLARIQPYRTVDNVIDGVVMTFTDITLRVAAEAAVEEARRVAQSIVDAVREPLVVLDARLRVSSASRAFYRQFHVKPEETVGRSIFDIGDGQWSIPALRGMLEAVATADRSFDDFVVTHDFAGVGPLRLVLNARRILGTAGTGAMILLAMENAGPGGTPAL
ncbi:MAG: chemotaxis protein CheB [Deltaproteobacteria bacterium]